MKERNVRNEREGMRGVKERSEGERMRGVTGREEEE